VAKASPVIPAESPGVPGNLEIHQDLFRKAIPQIVRKWHGLQWSVTQILPDEPLVHLIPDRFGSQAVKVLSPVFGVPSPFIAFLDARPSSGPEQSILDGRLALARASNKLATAVGALFHVAVQDVVLARGDATIGAVVVLIVVRVVHD
jgi:hypothetical protein